MEKYDYDNEINNWIYKLNVDDAFIEDYQQQCDFYALTIINNMKSENLNLLELLSYADFKDALALTNIENIFDEDVKENDILKGLIMTINNRSFVDAVIEANNVSLATTLILNGNFDKRLFKILLSAPDSISLDEIISITGIDSTAAKKLEKEALICAKELVEDENATNTKNSFKVLERIVGFTRRAHSKIIGG